MVIGVLIFTLEFQMANMQLSKTYQEKKQSLLNKKRSAPTTQFYAPTILKKKSKLCKLEVSRKIWRGCSKLEKKEMF